MSKWLPQLSTANVLVFGDILLDRYWHGTTKRISPEAPVPVVNIKELEDRPGGAANVAVNISALGAQATLVGSIGNDEPGQILRQKLTQASVSHYLSRSESLPTITKLRVMSKNQQLIRLDFEQDYAHINHSEALQYFTNALKENQAVILSDYAKGALHQVQTLIALANQAGVPVLVDPKGTDFDRYKNATLLTPNLSEFEAVVGPCSSQAQLLEKGRALIESLNLTALLVTQGEHGMTVIERNHEAHHFQSQAREVFDVTGAGDTVIAVLATALAAKAPLSVAVELANIAAGIVVGKSGTATASCEEIFRAVAEQSMVPQGAMTQEKLFEQVSAAKMRGEKIVMTNGCFDILHAGHLQYLEQARRLGDRLLIAVNDDASVARLKGPERPINGLSQRMALLAGLRCVDWVVPFTEDTPAKLIAQVSPHILVKGGDYTVEQIAGADHVLARGGEVKILPLKTGYSTSKIVEKIQDQIEKVV